MTEASANGALRRARAALDGGLAAGTLEDAPLPDSAAEREVVSRFAGAFENGDVEGVVALLTDDASLTMPPQPLEYVGPSAIAGFLSTVPAGGRLDRLRLVPTRANGQPAFGCYVRGARVPIAHAYGLMVLTLRGGAGWPRSPAFRAQASSPTSACRGRCTSRPRWRSRCGRPARSEPSCGHPGW